MTLTQLNKLVNKLSTAITENSVGPLFAESAEKYWREKDKNDKIIRKVLKAEFNDI